MSDLTPLSQVTTSIQYGYTASSSPKANGPKLLRITDIQKGAVDWDAVPRCLIEDNIRSRFLLKEGDILFARSGATVGKSFLVCGDNHDAVFASYLIRVRFDQAKVDPRYAYFFFASKDYWDQVNEGAAGTGQPNFNGTKLAALRIPVPSLAEQRRIVARIEALFARTRRARTDLERIAPLSRRYVEATTDRAFLADEDAGWTTSTAGQLCDIKSGLTLGKRYASETELVERPYLRVANVQRGHLRLDEIKTVRLAAAEAARLVLRDGDVLMNEGGDRDKLGRGWVWEGQIPNCVHQNHVFRLRLRSDVVTPKFLSRYANHAGARYFLDEGKQTTNLASISMSKVAALPVPVPPNGIAARIDTLLDTADTSARILQTEATRALALLDRLEQSILARAFRGDLVPPVPEEEAAMEAQVSVEKGIPVRGRRKVRAFAA